MVGETSGDSVRVFILEAHSAVRLALQRRLDATCHLIVIGVAHQAPCSLTYLRAIRPDVILVGLPHQVLQDPSVTATTVSRLAQIAPVIVLATYAEELERDTILQAGAQRYLLKQINTGCLIREIEMVATGRDRK